MAKKAATGKKTPAVAAPPADHSIAFNIGISAKDRAAIAGGLSQLLAGTSAPYLTTHNFHWNVTGPMFDTLHTMFMAQYTELGPRWTPSPSASAVWAIPHPADTRSSPA